MCDEIIEVEETKTNFTTTFTKNFNEKKATCKTQTFFILLEILLITIALLIAVSIYWYLIKYGVKQKYLSPFHVTNDKLINVL